MTHRLVAIIFLCLSRSQESDPEPRLHDLTGNDAMLPSRMIRGSENMMVQSTNCEYKKERANQQPLARNNDDLGVDDDRSQHKQEKPKGLDIIRPASDMTPISEVRQGQIAGGPTVRTEVKSDRIGVGPNQPNSVMAHREEPSWDRSQRSEERQGRPSWDRSRRNEERSERVRTDTAHLNTTVVYGGGLSSGNSHQSAERRGHASWDHSQYDEENRQSDFVLSVPSTGDRDEARGYSERRQADHADGGAGIVGSAPTMARRGQQLWDHSVRSKVKSHMSRYRSKSEESHGRIRSGAVMSSSNLVYRGDPYSALRSNRNNRPSSWDCPDRSEETPQRNGAGIIKSDSGMVFRGEPSWDLSLPSEANRRQLSWDCSQRNDESDERIGAGIIKSASSMVHQGEPSWDRSQLTKENRAKKGGGVTKSPSAMVHGGEPMRDHSPRNEETHGRLSGIITLANTAYHRAKRRQRTEEAVVLALRDPHCENSTLGKDLLNLPSLTNTADRSSSPTSETPGSSRSLDSDPAQEDNITASLVSSLSDGSLRRRNGLQLQTQDLSGPPTEITVLAMKKKTGNVLHNDTRKGKLVMPNGGCPSGYDGSKPPTKSLSFRRPLLPRSADMTRQSSCPILTHAFPPNQSTNFPVLAGFGLPLSRSRLLRGHGGEWTTYLVAEPVSPWTGPRLPGENAMRCLSQKEGIFRSNYEEWSVTNKNIASLNYVSPADAALLGNRPRRIVHDLSNATIKDRTRPSWAAGSIAEPHHECSRPPVVMDRHKPEPPTPLFPPTTAPRSSPTELTEEPVETTSNNRRRRRSGCWSRLTAPAVFVVDPRESNEPGRRLRGAVLLQRSTTGCLA
jgi:hypothetical protein